MVKSYENLAEHFHRISNLENARAILHWDEAVMMPAGSGNSRNQSLAELAAVIQDLTCEAQVGQWLDEAAQAENIRHLDDWQKANLREMKRLYTEATSIPPALLKASVIARMNCEQKWRQSRSENDWTGFKPYLDEVLRLTREMLGFLGEARGLSVYDAALSLYSSGLTTEVVERLFNELKSFLPSLIEQVVDRQKRDNVVVPEGRFPIEVQRALGLELMEAIGFDFNIGRVDVSHHPFCGGTSRDVRITTRYDQSNFAPALMGILHETGHAIYEQRLPENWLGQPVGAAAGMSVHESQSLLMEMQICRSREFLEFAAPFIQKHLRPYTKNPEALRAENLALLATRVAPGLIRVDADEVTYPAHVILRFEIERELIEGSLNIQDLPEIWNEKMKAYLGVTTSGNDRDGCMQDVHWPSGSFGYFPAYTFGAVIAAQLFAQIHQRHPDISQRIAQGNFTLIQGWLEENVWSSGSRLTTLELVSAAAGPLTADAFRRHLERRYLS